MDATLIATPNSSKNQSGERDPEMHRAKKGKQWHFGMKRVTAREVGGRSGTYKISCHGTGLVSVKVDATARVGPGHHCCH